MVIAVVGADHQHLLDFVTPTFSQIPRDTPDTKTMREKLGNTVRYTGGLVAVNAKQNPALQGLTHLSLAFESPSWHSPDVFALCILQSMLGGGGSFSAGGPGKGMYSRLMENVLNKHNWVESAECVANTYDTSGVFGFKGTVTPDKVPDLLKTFLEQAVHMKGPISDEELSRAKNALKGSIYMQLEQSRLQAEDLVRQTLTYGKVTPVLELCQKIDAVSAGEIQRVAATMLRTAPSIAAVGDVSYLPRYQDVLAVWDKSV